MWIKALEIQFGWSRAQLTGAFSMAQLEGSIIGPLMGYLIDRLGPRKMVLIGFIITGLGFLLFSRTNSIVIFYLSYGMIMLGTAAGTWLPFMSRGQPLVRTKAGRVNGGRRPGFAIGRVCAGAGPGLGGNPGQSRLGCDGPVDRRGVPRSGMADVAVCTGKPGTIRPTPRRRPTGLRPQGSVQGRKGSAIA